MKKTVFAVLCCMILLITPSLAADITIDDVKIVFTDAEPVVKDGRTLAPLRAVAEGMQADVTWNEGDKSIILSKEASDVSYEGKHYDKVVFVGEMQLGSFMMRIKMLHNGNEIYNVKKEMDIRAQSINDRAYVPARYVGYALGYETEWKDNTVCYRDIKTQNTSFTVDKNVKFPDIYSETFPFRIYRGYDNIAVADLESGTRTVMRYHYDGRPVYHYQKDAYQYGFAPVAAFDSEKFNIELSNPEATIENFKMVYDDVATPNYAILDYQDYRGTLETLLMLSRDWDRGNTAVLRYFEEKIPVGVGANPAQWGIEACRMPIDCTHYRYPDSSGAYVPGYESLDHADDRYGATDGLILLHTFLNETGERIWKMMSEYYTCSGRQAAQEPEYVSADFIMPPIGEDVPALYGLRYQESGVDRDGTYELVLGDEVNGNHIIIRYKGAEINPNLSGPHSLLIRYGFRVFF